MHVSVLNKRCYEDNARGQIWP